MLILEVESDEQVLLLELLESRIGELAPEIRRSRNQRVHDGLQRQRVALERLAERLRPLPVDAELAGDESAQGEASVDKQPAGEGQ